MLILRFSVTDAKEWNQFVKLFRLGSPDSGSMLRAFAFSCMIFLCLYLVTASSIMMLMALPVLLNLCAMSPTFTVFLV